MAEVIDTVVIGGGQAGLAASYFLTQQGRDHVVLERSRVGESWRSGRWDSFTLVTPSWSLLLPGFHYHGDDPDGFLARDEVVEYLERYVELFNPPLRLGVEATSVEQGPDGSRYIVETSSGPLEAINVIVAAGMFQKPRIPPFSSSIASQILQIHASEYRNPDAVPPRRCPGGWDRTIGRSDCSGTLRGWTQGVLVRWQRWQVSPALPWKGHGAVAQRDGLF